MPKSTNLPSKDHENATINPKNKIWNTYVKNNPTGRQKEASKLFQNLSFADEWKLLYNGSKIIQITCGIASFASLFLCFYFALSIRFNSKASIVLALIICAAIEVFKGFSWSKLAKYVLKYKTYPFALLALAVGLNLVSVIGSAIGAYLTPITQQQTAQQASVPLVNIDSLKHVFDQEMAAINTTIQDYTNEIKKTSSNSTKRSLNKSILEFNQTLNNKTESANFAIKNAREYNQTVIQERKESEKNNKNQQQQQNNRNRTIIVSLTILFELLLIGSYCFISYYLFRLHIDETVPTSNTAPVDTATIQAPESSFDLPNILPAVTPAINNTKQPIGFGTLPNEIYHNPTPTVQDAKPKEGRQKHCQYCNKLFDYKNESAKYCSANCRGKAYRKRQ